MRGIRTACHRLSYSWGRTRHDDRRRSGRLPRRRGGGRGRRRRRGPTSTSCADLLADPGGVGGAAAPGSRTPSSRRSPPRRPSATAVAPPAPRPRRHGGATHRPAHRARRPPPPSPSSAVGGFVLVNSVTTTGPPSSASGRPSSCQARAAAGDIASTESGWRIEIDATRPAPPRRRPLLPGLAEGRRRRPRADRHVQRGRDVVLWAGVSPVEFSTLTVTEEEADGDQASSGRRVLVGTIDVEPCTVPEIHPPSRPRTAGMLADVCRVTRGPSAPTETAGRSDAMTRIHADELRPGDVVALERRASPDHPRRPARRVGLADRRRRPRVGHGPRPRPGRRPPRRRLTPPTASAQVVSWRRRGRRRTRSGRTARGRRSSRRCPRV